MNITSTFFYNLFPSAQDVNTLHHCYSCFSNHRMKKLKAKVSQLNTHKVDSPAFHLCFLYFVASFSMIVSVVISRPVLITPKMMHFM